MWKILCFQAQNTLILNFTQQPHEQNQKGDLSVTVPKIFFVNKNSIWSPIYLTVSGLHLQPNAEVNAKESLYLKEDCEHCRGVYMSQNT